MIPGRCGQAPRPGARFRNGAGAAPANTFGAKTGRPRRMREAALDARPGSPAARCAGFGRSESLRMRFPAEPKGSAGGGRQVASGAGARCRTPAGETVRRVWLRPRRNACSAGRRSHPAPGRAGRRGGSPVLQAELVLGFGPSVTGAENFLIVSNMRRLIRLIAPVSFYVYVHACFILVSLIVLPIIFF